MRILGELEYSKIVNSELAVYQFGPARLIDLISRCNPCTPPICTVVLLFQHWHMTVVRLLTLLLLSGITRQVWSFCGCTFLLHDSSTLQYYHPVRRQYDHPYDLCEAWWSDSYFPSCVTYCAFSVGALCSLAALTSGPKVAASLTYISRNICRIWTILMFRYWVKACLQPLHLLCCQSGLFLCLAILVSCILLMWWLPLKSVTDVETYSCLVYFRQMVSSLGHTRLHQNRAHRLQVVLVAAKPVFAVRSSSALSLAVLCLSGCAGAPWLIVQLLECKCMSVCQRLLANTVL